LYNYGAQYQIKFRKTVPVMILGAVYVEESKYEEKIQKSLGIME
jgi:hypothetical protein